MPSFVKCFLFVFLLTNSFLTRQLLGQDCVPVLTKDYNNNFEVIFIGEVYSVDVTDSTVNCNLVELFKGDLNIKKQVQFERIKCNPFLFEDGFSYLFYANITGNKLTAPVCSRTDLLALRKDDIDLLNKLPCYKTVSEEQKKSGCEKNIDPVCDCEGKEYHNVCDAIRNGLLRYQKCP